MINHTNHTAHYQVSCFISDKSHVNFKLTSYEIVILWTIARYLDMKNKKCFAKQITLAMECGMSERQFRNSCQILVDHKIIVRTVIGKLYHYYLGPRVTNQEEF